MADLVEEFWDLELIESLYPQARRTTPADFRDALHQLFGRRGELLLTGSGRQALRVLFKHLAAGSPRRRVLLSSYNCRVVREAAHQAGLAVDTFDFASARGHIDWLTVTEALTDQHLAVVVPHFFGIPYDFRALLPGAQARGVCVIEDCAHAFGARIAGVPAGLLGDAAVFSFNYDKPMSLAGGGALLLHHPDLRVSRAAVERVLPARWELHQFRQLAGTLRYNRTPRGRRPFIARVGGKLRVPPYAPPRVPAGFGPLRAAVGLWQLERYAAVRAQRDANAQRLLSALGELAWQLPDAVTPAHLKLRVSICAADGVRAAAFCKQHLIAVANSNWPRLIEADGPSPARPWAAQAAATGLEVPVHQNLSAEDLAIIAEAFRGARPPGTDEPAA
jgi:dTDP-4-amino-4,6-dideoxygalactose transaminase